MSRAASASCCATTLPGDLRSGFRSRDSRLRRAARLRRRHLDHRSMQDAYLELHRRGFAHSVEVWDEGNWSAACTAWRWVSCFWRIDVQPRRQRLQMALPRWCSI
jgi:hypothetical protein